MRIQVACPECLKSAGLDSSLVGKKVRCKGCGHVFKVSDDASESDLGSDSPADSSWLDDGADGEAAEPAAMIPRSARGSSAGGGPSLGLMIGLGAGAALLLSLVVGLFVFGGGRGPAPAADRQAEPGLFDRVVGAVTGHDPSNDAAKYPELGPLPPPLLPPPPPRDLSVHEQRVRAQIGSIDRMAGILATVHDAPSSKSAGEQFQSEGKRMAEEMRRNPPPFRLTFAEEAELARRTAGDTRKAIARIRQESQRIAGIPEVSIVGVQLIGLADRLALPLEADLRRVESFEPSSAGPPPYAEVFVQLQNADDAPFFRHKLNELLEEDGRGRGFQGTGATQDDAPRAAYRVWPVDDPKAFSRRIPRGEAKVKGRQIFVKAEPIPVAELAAAQDALRQIDEAREAKFRAATAPSPEEANDPAPPADADDLTEALFATRSSRPHKRKEGVNQLARMTPDDARRDEVHKQLEALLTDGDGFLVIDIMKAMVKWRTDGTVPALIKMLDHSSFGVRWEAEEILGKLGDPRAAKPLAARLKEDGIKAEPALRALGPAAEPALIAILRDPDPELRIQACDILKDVGGRDALETMMTLPADPDAGVQSAARRAMQAMRARVGPIPAPGKKAAQKAATGNPG